MTPELSIIVPTYQRPDTLERALASIAAATACSVEIIVVDDCPQGSAFAIANRHGARYVCKAGIDRGLSASRNVGLGLARGRWLAFLDDDDFFAAQGLDGLLSKASTARGIVFGDYTAFNTETCSDIDLSSLKRDALLVVNHIPVGAYIIERAAVVQQFDTRLRSHEDWDFLLTHTTNNELHHVPGVVVLIDKTQVHSTSMLARRRKLAWLDHLSIWARFPSSHLSAQRAQLLRTLGVELPPELLRFEDEI
jgi:glycosyltransferase involved in cell wall biosynthesis